MSFSESPNPELRIHKDITHIQVFVLEAALGYNCLDFSRLSGASQVWMNFFLQRLGILVDWSRGDKGGRNKGSQILFLFAQTDCEQVSYGVVGSATAELRRAPRHRHRQESP